MNSMSDWFGSISVGGQIVAVLIAALVVLTVVVDVVARALRAVMRRGR